MQLTPENITNKKILISPLDWGMGHTTRCVALIRTLLSNKNEILFAGNNSQIEFIKREFPELKTEFLEGYNITLDSKKSTYLQVFLQIQKLNNAIKSENEFAERIAEKEKIDIIISDNRYGFRCHASQCKTTNILLTHQLSLPIPKWKKLANKKLKSFIEKFDLCWIPDSETNPICGELTNVSLTIPKLFIGHLSRFKKHEDSSFSFGEGAQRADEAKGGTQYKLLAIISGPEPERSNFAKKISEHLAHEASRQNGKSAIVGIKSDNSTIDFYENPTTQELEKLIHQSETIISRAGYTTIMEMIALEKNAILIPTQGQFEQEYLAKTISHPNLTFKNENDFFNYDVI